MGLFNTKKFKVEKAELREEIKYYIDFNKHPDSFPLKTLGELSEGKPILFVVDMDILYDKKGTDAEGRIAEIKEELGKYGIVNKELITQRDSDVKLLGIRIQKPDKINIYQLGFVLSPEQLNKLSGILTSCNLFCYISAGDMTSEQLLESFGRLRGDYEELKKLSAYDLYVDYYLRRIRICMHR